jgi:hypothetical protein
MGEMGACPWPCCAKASAERNTLRDVKRNAMRKMLTRLRLLIRGVVAGLRVDVEGREPSGWPQLDFDLTPSSVVQRVA